MEKTVRQKDSNDCCDCGRKLAIYIWLHLWHSDRQQKNIFIEIKSDTIIIIKIETALP